MRKFAEIILPLPLAATFTYEVPEELTADIRPGHRVLVQFGRKKCYTGIVAQLTHIEPEGIDVKPIMALLDMTPILRHPQLKLWEWVADYYLCSVGEVMRAALPSALKVESETLLEPNPDYEETPDERLTERQAMVIQVLYNAGKRMSVAEIERATGYSNVSQLATQMLERGMLMVSEKLVERYVSRKVTYLRLRAERGDDGARRRMFALVNRAEKQQRALMALMELSGFMKRSAEMTEVSMDELLERSGVTRPVIREMEKKGLVEIYKKEINRFAATELVTGQLPELSEAQRKALDGLHKSWLEHEVTLLHGVTSSGKTEIYIHLIDYTLRQRRQVLFLVPEIALTTQLTRRLQRVFGDKVVIYHSKFTDNERVDIYRKILQSTEPMVIIGARSAVFLPFSNLGLIIVDEEHEQSFKQQDPSPRYNGRDTAMVLARMHGAKTLLGSATPAIDTYYKAQTGRYGLVTLNERFGGVKLPEMRMVYLRQGSFSGPSRGGLADETVGAIRKAVREGGQAIVFLNRRGYAPVAQCRMCAFTPKCEHCDVSLTYHKRIDKLVCHYCGAIYPLPTICPACKSPTMEILGYGTERMEDEIAPALGEDTKVLRMDLDTTRNKDGYATIINEFSRGAAQVLVGTQMVTKGLDFDRVRTVAISNADSIINQPDFRSAERAFNMIAQVSGRAGRRDTQGEVLIQTRQPDHPLFGYLLTHDYEGYYNHELEQRRRFNYPPFTRLIYIYLKHRDARTVESLAVSMSGRLRQLFGNRVYGPEEPAVGRVQSFYIRKLMLKIESEASMKKVREILRRVIEEVNRSNLSIIRGAVIYFDVDPM